MTFFFARDPAARDRLGRARVPALPTVREAAPPEPERCVVRPPDGAGSYRVLAGELLEAPCGLRLASRPQRIGGRVELPVTPAGFDALAAIEGRARREPLLRAPLIAPSRVRAAMIAGGEPGPVAVLLEVMADPTLQFDRLRRELARLEPEARDLERRLRGLLEDERGLRAVAVSIRGVARTVDVFASSRDLADALPRLLRAALLEAALEAPDELAAVGMDPRSAGIELGVKETRERHEALLAALLDVRGRADADGVFERTGPNDAAALWLAGAELLQATAVVRR
ncbi:MAG: hypothetical protein KF878_20635 [Planctomycetes bacterium]|nr:hypothetical protein [Planctomycetota bacterium]